MIGLDTTVLTLLLNDKAGAPPDPATGKPVTQTKERIEFLVTTLHKQRQQIVIPTPVLSEALVRSGMQGLQYVQLLQKWTVFDVRGFNELEAIELAIMHQNAKKKTGHKKGEQQDENWQKIKIDRQIVAICKVAKVKTIYASDRGLSAFAKEHGIEVCGVHELPLPPVDAQMSMTPTLEASLTNRPPIANDDEIDSGEDAIKEIEGSE